MDFIKRHFKNLGSYLGIIFISGILGVILGGLILMILGIKYDNNDSYRLVYALCALFLCPMISYDMHDDIK